MSLAEGNLAARSSRRQAGVGPAPGVVLAGRLVRQAVLGAAGIAVLVLAWAAIASVSNPTRVPSPGDVWTALRDGWASIPALQFVAFQSGGIAEALGYTTVNVLMGVAIGSAAGFVAGAALGRYDRARELLQVPLLLLGTMPVLIVLPFLLLWFGATRLATSGLVIAFAFVTVSAVVQSATKELITRHADHAASLGASRRRVVWQVLVPGALPAAVGAIRVAAAAGWSFEAVAELVGGQSGTGKLISAMQGLTATPEMMAIVIAVGCAGLILDAALAALGGWAVRWKE